MAGAVVVRVVRPLCLRAQRREVDERLRVDPLVAGELLDSGRAVLVDVTDGAAIRAARIAEAGRLNIEAERARKRSALLGLVSRK